MSFNPVLLMIKVVADFKEVYTNDASFGMSLDVNLVKYLGVTEILAYARKCTVGSHQVFLTRAREGRIHLIAVHLVNDRDFILSPSDEIERDNFIMNSQPRHLYARDSAEESYKLLRFSAYLWIAFFYGSLIASVVTKTTDYLNLKFPFDFMAVLSSVVWHLCRFYSARANKHYVHTLKEFNLQDRAWFRAERILQKSQFKSNFKKFSKHLVFEVVCTV